MALAVRTAEAGLDRRDRAENLDSMAEGYREGGPGEMTTTTSTARNRKEREREREVIGTSVARFSEAIYRTFLLNVGHFLGHITGKSDKQSESHTDPLLFEFYCIFMPQFF